MPDGKDDAQKLLLAKGHLKAGQLQEAFRLLCETRELRGAKESLVNLGDECLYGGHDFNILSSFTLALEAYKLGEAESEKFIGLYNQCIDFLSDLEYQGDLDEIPQAVRIAKGALEAIGAKQELSELKEILEELGHKLVAEGKDKRAEVFYKAVVELE